MITVLLHLYFLIASSFSLKKFHSNLENNQGPRFLISPNFGFLYFSNQTGTSIHCTAFGSPKPKIFWITTEHSESVASSVNEPITEKLYIRQILSNGTVIFPPFNFSLYRQDVHSATYRCVAKNEFGLIISQPLHLRAVIDQRYEISVYDEFVIRGNTGVFKCQIPSVMTSHLNVISWIKNDEMEITENNEKYSIFNSGEFHIRNIDKFDSQYRYRCKAKNILTNVTQVSESEASIIISEPSHSIPPRITDKRSILIVEENSSFLEIPCSAEAWPLPSYRWYKNINQKSLPTQILIAPNPSFETAYNMRGGSLILRNIKLQDMGKYVCIASNSLGEAIVETEIKVWSKLKAKIVLDYLIVNTNKRALINCSLEGHPKEKIFWVQNGQQIRTDDKNRRIKFSGSHSVLTINSISSNDIGMYQCFVENQNGDSDQDSIQLYLGDVSPYFIEVFDSKLVNIGDKVFLKCAASGIPLPMITWTLDGRSLDEIKNDLSESRNLRQAMWGDYVVFGKNQVISHVNLTIESVFDGGHYECIAKNKESEIKHKATIKVNGEIRIRNMQNQTGTATQSILLHCWLLSVRPLSIYWQKDGRDLPSNHRQLLHKNGSLEIINLNKLIDSGIYSCLVNVNQNNRVETIKESFTLKVLNPPVIQDFKFDSKLMAGMRTRIYCNIAQGDLPVIIEWFKDGQSLNQTYVEGIKIKKIDQYSHSLMIENLSSIHNGNFTCKASNEASSVNHTAQLLVNIPPSWLIEPKNQMVIQGRSINIDCIADGYPLPLITWKYLKFYDSNSSSMSIVSQYKLIRSGPHHQVYENGTLRITNTQITDKGTYLCQASNGIGSGLSKIIHLKINIPVYFESNKLVNLTAIKDDSIEIKCEANGDQPINITWSKGGQDIDFSKESRYSFEESITNKKTTSKLVIKLISRSDSNLFKCKASNQFDKAIKLFLLKVKEAPEAPINLKFDSKSSRSVAISWKIAYDKIPINQYLIKIKKVNDLKLEEKNLTIFGNYSTTVIQDLQPSSNYLLTVYAINEVGISEPSESLEVKTSEEPPSSPPINIRVFAINSSAIKVDWNPPKLGLLNEHFQGFYIGYKVLNSSDHFLYKTVPAHLNLNQINYSVYISSLLPFTAYAIILQAFNSAGAGPRSDEFILRTFESVPSKSPPNVQCVSLSSSSLKIFWDNMSKIWINGHLRGYKIRYHLVTNKNERVDKFDKTRESTNHITFFNLDKFSNYSFSVAGFTSVGDGLYSDPIYCMTNEDIPTPPEEIKVAISSLKTIYVAWRAPAQANGIIQNYKVYRQSSEDNSIFTFTVSPNYYSHKVTELITGQVYNFWVTASTGAGEGPTSAIVSKLLSSTAPAKIINFGQTIESLESSSLDLACFAVGIPNPSYKWYFNDMIIFKNYSHQSLKKAIMKDSLRITDLSFKESGNYSCHVSNTYGSDFIIYHVIVKPKKVIMEALLPPEIHILDTTNSSIVISWRSRIVSEANFVIAQKIFFKVLNSLSYWKELTIDERTSKYKNYTITDLNCGKMYQLYMISISKYGKSRPSDIVQVKIKGREPVPPNPFQVFHLVNLTCLSVNLKSWSNGGCLIIETQIKWKKITSNTWNIMNINSNFEKVYLNDLDPSLIYKVTIFMINSAGSTIVGYDIQTSPYSVKSLSNSWTNTELNSIFSNSNSNYSNGQEENFTLSLFFSFFLLLILILIIVFSLFLFNKEIRQKIIGNGSLNFSINKTVPDLQVDQKSSKQKELENELVELAMFKKSLERSKSKSLNYSKSDLVIEENPYQQLTFNNKHKLSETNKMNQEQWSPFWFKNRKTQAKQTCINDDISSNYSMPKIDFCSFSNNHTLPKEKISAHASNNVQFLQNRLHSSLQTKPNCSYCSLKKMNCSQNEQWPVELIQLSPTNDSF